MTKPVQQQLDPFNTVLEQLQYTGVCQEVNWSVYWEVEQRVWDEVDAAVGLALREQLR